MAYTAAVTAEVDIFPRWERATREAWRLLRRWAALDPTAEVELSTRDAERELSEARRERDALERRGAWAAAKAVFARVLLLEAALWARVVHNGRVALKREVLREWEAVRLALGGLAACERWWRRTLIARRRGELGEVARRAVEPGAPRNRGERREAEREVYPDGTVVPRLSRREAVRAAERRWAVVSYRKSGATVSRMMGEGLAVRFAPVHAVRRAREAVRVELEAAGEAWQEVRESAPWPEPTHVHLARVVPEVWVTPEELGWRPEMTGDGEAAAAEEAEVPCGISDEPGSAQSTAVSADRKRPP